MPLELEDEELVVIPPVPLLELALEEDVDEALDDVASVVAVEVVVLPPDWPQAKAKVKEVNERRKRRFIPPS